MPTVTGVIHRPRLSMNAVPDLIERETRAGHGDFRGDLSVMLEKGAHGFLGGATRKTRF